MTNPAAAAYPRSALDRVRDAYVLLCQEPWCMTPDQVARLTDWQILHLYAIPAAERAERLEQKAGVKPSRDGRSREAAEPGTPEHRREVVGGMVGVMGWAPERAAAEYDRQLALWRAQGGR